MSAGFELDVRKVPKELRDRRSWVTWRVEDQGGRTVKPPFNSRTGQKAKSNDPSTWGTFDEVIAAYEGGGYDGVGFQLTPPFVGVDLDGCRNPKTGFIDDGARAIITQLNSYTEVSPSGTGVHILVKGTLPPGGRRTKGIELYDGDRYFTVTGQHLPNTPLTVELQHAALGKLHERVFGKRMSATASQPYPKDTSPARIHGSVSLSDAELLDKMTAANNGNRFEKLWRGEWQGDYLSQSEADFQLCRNLAFWTGKDAERIDRLFRQSCLYRSKWDRQHGTSTYGEITIANAVRKQESVWAGAAPAGGEE